MSGPMRGTRLVQWGSTVVWAIVPEALARMAEIATREPFSEAQIEAVAAQLGRPLDNSRAIEMRGEVAVIPVVGPIFRYADAFTRLSGGATVEALGQDVGRALADPQVGAILLNIDSPGGEAAGIAELSDLIRAGRARKPILAYIGGDGCSAAYWLASAASAVVVDSTAQVGSIGAVMSYPNPDARPGAPPRLEFVSSQSPMKRPDVRTDDGRAHLQSRVDALAQVFIDGVAANRGISAEAVAATGGAIFIGQQAVDLDLADRLGSFESVVAELATAAREARDPLGARRTPATLPSGGRWAASTEEADMAQEQPQRGRFERFMAWMAGEGDDSAFVPAQIASQGPSPTPATAPLVSASAASRPDPRVAELEAEIARMRAQEGERARGAIAARAASFADEEIRASRATPTEREALVAAFADAATDDLDHPRAEGQPSRVDRLVERQAARPAHAMTQELVPVRPEGDGTLSIATEPTTRKEGDTQPMTPERWRALYGHTATGQRILAEHGIPAKGELTGAQRETLAAAMRRKGLVPA